MKKIEKLNLKIKIASIIFYVLFVLWLMITLSSCTKQNIQSYRINNLTGVDLNIITPENTYIIETTESIFFTSTSEPIFTLSDEKLKILVQKIGTSPEHTYNIFSYLYYFEVKVDGNADNVDISINGKYFNEKIPFYYGTDDIPETYNVISEPDKTEHVFTSVYLNGNCIDIKEGICNLKGKL